MKKQNFWNPYWKFPHFQKYFSFFKIIFSIEKKFDFFSNHYIDVKCYQESIYDGFNKFWVLLPRVWSSRKNTIFLI